MTFTNGTSGTWAADAAHSEIGFIVRHAGISKVREEGVLQILALQ